MRLFCSFLLNLSILMMLNKSIITFFIRCYCLVSKLLSKPIFRVKCIFIFQQFVLLYFYLKKTFWCKWRWSKYFGTLTLKTSWQFNGLFDCRLSAIIFLCVCLCEAFFLIRPPSGLLPVLGPLERFRLLHLMWPCFV